MQLLSKYPNLVLENSQFGQKVTCKLTGHQFKPTETNLLMYLNSKDYKKGLEKWYDEEVFLKYAPRIVPHSKKPKKLFCTVTKRTLNMIPQEVENHVNGKNYQKKLLERENLEKKRAERIAKRKRKVSGNDSSSHSEDNSEDEDDDEAQEEDDESNSDLNEDETDSE